MENAPKQLQKLLNMLMDDSIVSGWSLFGGTRQKLIIYFDENSATMDSEVKSQPDIQYKRKSQKQSQRDKDRAVAHADSKRPCETDNITGNNRITRSMATEIADKECPRADISVNLSCAPQVPLTPVDLNVSNSQSESMHDNSLDLSLSPPSPTPLPVSQEPEPQSPQPLTEADISSPKTLAPDPQGNINKDNKSGRKKSKRQQTNTQLADNRDSYVCAYTDSGPKLDHKSSIKVKCEVCNIIVCDICRHFHNQDKKNPCRPTGNYIIIKATM